MYALGIPNKQYRRTTQVLGYERDRHIPFKSEKQEDGFFMFYFPEADEYDFRDIVKLLKSNGITTIGADNQLTEKNIMKLTSLLKEQPSPDENSLIDILKDRLETMEDPQYRGGLDGCEKSNHFLEEIREIIEDYEEGGEMDAIAMGADDARDMQFEQVSNPTPFGGEIGTMGDQIKNKFKGTLDGELIDFTFKGGEGDDEDIKNVKISFKDEEYTLNFVYDEIVFEDEYSSEAIYSAKSEDGMWNFEMAVLVDKNFVGGQCNPCVIEYPYEHPEQKGTHLKITKVEDPRMDPAIRSDFDDPILEENWEKKQLLIRAGIIK